MSSLEVLVKILFNIHLIIHQHFKRNINMAFQAESGSLCRLQTTQAEGAFSQRFSIQILNDKDVEDMRINHQEKLNQWARSSQPNGAYVHSLIFYRLCLLFAQERSVIIVLVILPLRLRVYPLHKNIIIYQWPPKHKAIENIRKLFFTYIYHINYCQRINDIFICVQYAS